MRLCNAHNEKKVIPLQALIILLRQHLCYVVQSNDRWQWWQLGRTVCSSLCSFVPKVNSICTIQHGNSRPSWKVTSEWRAVLVASAYTHTPHSRDNHCADLQTAKQIDTRFTEFCAGLTRMFFFFFAFVQVTFQKSSDVLKEDTMYEIFIAVTAVSERYRNFPRFHFCR